MSKKIIPTNNQQQVIDFPRESNQKSSGNLLVSASAGSGKTQTLVNRIINLLTKNFSDKNISIDRLLITTFTNKAAQEMRNRLEDELRKQLEETEQNDNSNKLFVGYLEEQISLLPSASISTIDAFIIRLIDQYYDVIGIDPNYSLLADSAQVELYNQEVLDTFFDKKVADNDKEFSLLVENFNALENENALKEILISIWEKSIIQKNPNQFLEQLSKKYEVDYTESDENLPTFISLFFDKTLNQVADFSSEIKEFIRLIRDDNPQKATSIIESWSTLQESIDSQLNSGFSSYQKIKSVNELIISSGKIPTVSKNNFSQAVIQSKDHLKNSKDFLKKELSKFKATEQQEKAIFFQTKKVVGALLKTVQEFANELQEKKIQDNVMTFADLGQSALAITENKDIQEQLYSQFDEVMIDEYQDVNPMQQTILENIADGKLFMVGDVKQSIYRFRQADPTLFQDKYENYHQNKNGNVVLELPENWRSSQQVLSAANLVFDRIMSRNLGGIDYLLDRQELIFGNSEKFSSVQDAGVELLINIHSKNEDSMSEEQIENEQSSENEEQLVEDEPTIVAKKIQELVLDKKIKYSDILVLSRSKNPFIELGEQLDRFGIPYETNGKENYFQTMEISIMLELLKIIDNPIQDIPLVAVLRSQIVGLDENDLAEIRLIEPNKKFYFALLEANKNPDVFSKKDAFERVNTFVSHLNRWHEFSKNNRISELIWQIYEDTGWLNFVAGIPNGQQRKLNLRALYSRAKNYQEANFYGLNRFIRYVELLQKNNKDLEEAPANSNLQAVRLMTIHASKGLEAKYVFLINANSKRNNPDEKSAVVIEPHTGISAIVNDQRQNVSFKSLAYYAIADALKREDTSEFMRLLYVAMTRAENKLFVIGTYSSVHSLAEKWRFGLQKLTTFSGEELFNGGINTMMDFIGAAFFGGRNFREKVAQGMNKLNVQSNEKLIDEIENFQENIKNDQAINFELNSHFLKAEQVSNVQVKFYNQPAQIQSKQSFQKKKLSVINEEKLLNQLKFQYPFELATKTLATQTVSEIKSLKDMQDPDRISDELIEDDNLIITQDIKNESVTKFKFDDPLFMKENPLSVNRFALIGTAVHSILERIDWSNNTSQQVDSILDQLVFENIIDSKIASSINKKEITDFISGETPYSFLVQEIKSHQDTLIRERPFSLYYDADKIYQTKELSSEGILIHGKIDGYIIDEQHQTITLFDYKTNAQIESDEAFVAKIKSLYKTQLELYSAALERNYPDFTVKKYIIALSARKIIEF